LEQNYSPLCAPGVHSPPILLLDSFPSINGPFSSRILRVLSPAVWQLVPGFLDLVQKTSHFWIETFQIPKIYLRTGTRLSQLIPESANSHLTRGFSIPPKDRVALQLPEK
jgi:hypothetical protein